MRAWYCQCLVLLSLQICQQLLLSPRRKRHSIVTGIVADYVRHARADVKVPVKGVKVAAKMVAKRHVVQAVVKAVKGVVMRCVKVIVIQDVNLHVKVFVAILVLQAVVEDVIQLVRVTVVEVVRAIVVVSVMVHVVVHVGMVVLEVVLEVIYLLYIKEDKSKRGLQMPRRSHKGLFSNE